MTKLRAPKASARALVAAESDWHCGFRFGLLPPDVVLDPWADQEEPWTPRQTQVQRLVWGWLEENRERIVEWARGDEIVPLFLGDICHGTRSDHLVTDRMVDQYVIAVAALERWTALPNVRRIRVVKGSRWHSDTGGSTELTVARMARKYSGKDVRAWHHALLWVNGVSFDVAHRGAGRGRRAWTEDTEVRWYLKSIMLDHMKAGRKPPAVVLRGHYHDRVVTHQHIHTWDGTVDSWGVVIPACAVALDDYTHSATRSKSHMTVGTVVFEVVDGRVKDVLDLTHSLDIRREEILR